jgi:hypothetical protein
VAAEFLGVKENKGMKKQNSSRLSLLAVAGGVSLLGVLSACGAGTVGVVSAFGDDISNIREGDTIVEGDTIINADCNGNGIPDQDDIAGASTDCNGNTVPDECDVDLDCNQNGILDVCDLAAETSEDCNSNGIPDECEYDRDHDGVPDDCLPLATDPSAPGSLLVFPEWDSRFDGEVSIHTSLLTVTNIGDERVSVRLVFFDPSTCAPWIGPASTTARTINLEAHDTYTVSIADKFRVDHRGYAVACAVDADGRAISWNHLIGSVLIATGQRAQLVGGMDALAFQAVEEPGELTDIDDDGVQELDGVEYSAGPDKLLFSRVLGQRSDDFDDDLIVLQLSEAGVSELTVDLEVRNDRGVAILDQYTITPQLCWSKTSLGDISGEFLENTFDSGPNDPQEIDGWTAKEAGWFSISGRSTGSGDTQEPTLLAVLIARSSFPVLADAGVAVVPVFSGTRTSGGFDLGLSGTGGK